MEESNLNPYQNMARPQAPDGFSVGALICGTLSCIFFCTGILPIPFGALGIFFAYMSYKRGKQLSQPARVGIIFCVLGIVIGIFMTVYSFYMLFHNPEMMHELNTIYEQLYGISLEEMLGLPAAEITL